MPNPMGRLTIRLPQTEKDALTLHCKTMGISTNAFVRACLSPDHAPTLIAIQTLTKRLEANGVI